MAAPGIPTVLTPYPVDNFSTNIATQTIGGVAGANTVSMYVVQRPDIVISFNPQVSMNFSFTVLLTAGVNVLAIVGVASDGSTSPPYNLQITLTTASQLNVTAPQPTGMGVADAQASVTVTWQGSTSTGVVGYNVYNSSSPGGGTAGYTLLTPSPISEPFTITTVPNIISDETSVDNGITIEVIKSTPTQVSTYSYLDSKKKADGTIDTATYYYVVTSVVYDPISRQEVESVYSAEVVGQVLPMTQQINAMPTSTQRDILVRFVNSIFEAQPLMDVKSGTVSRDLLDVVAEELEDTYTILDFMNRAQSFITLINIDDATGTGVSDPVSTSVAKQALMTAFNLTTDADTQAVVDNAFTQLASTFGVSRIQAQPASAVVTFYTTAEPTTDLTVNVGDTVASQADVSTGTQQVLYGVVEQVIMYAAQASQYFNYLTDRWEIQATVTAQTPGTVGNVAAGAINSVVSGASGLGVTNTQPVTSGTDLEDNQSLAERTTLQLIGIDTGTRNGYLRVTLAIQDVISAMVVASGDPMMYRDWDPLRMKHIGGKVDIYVQGTEQYTQTVDTVPFGYIDNVSGAATVSSVVLMQFLVTGTQFNTPGNDIFSVSAVINLSRGSKAYNLTGYTILGPNLVCLDATNQDNLLIGLSSTDNIVVTYSRRQVEIYVLSHQPVVEILDVMGDLSGDLNNNYNFYKVGDPLFTGGSSEDTDSVQIFFSPLNSLPRDVTQAITNEPIVLIAEFPNPLQKVGVVLSSVKVKNQAQTVVYVPGVDYELVPDAITPYVTDIYRLIGGAIPDGATVLVSYQAGENVQITYTYDQTIESVAASVAKFQHLTADVVVKEANPVSIDFIIAVGLQSGQDQTTVDAAIRSAISSKIGGLKMGQSVYQSEVISWVENVTGVNYVSVPLARMVRSDNDVINGDILNLPPTNGWVVYATHQVTSWITTNPVLSYTTVDGGGLVYQPPGRPNQMFRHVAVYQDTQPLKALSTAAAVSSAAGQCFIRGDGYVIVSTLDGSSPDAHHWTASYIIIGEPNVAQDIIIGSMEYPVLGTLVLNY